MIEVVIRSEYPKAEVEETITQALRNQATVARLRRDHFQRLCAEFEKNMD